MGQIIEFPDDKRAREKIQELKKTLENLVFERDNLKFVICENIKTAYMLNFGSLEYRLYKAYCKYLRLKRKRDMIQAKKNRQKKLKSTFTKARKGVKNERKANKILRQKGQRQGYYFIFDLFF